MDLTTLSGDDLRKTYQGLRAMLSGQDPDSINVPNYAPDQLEANLRRDIAEFVEELEDDQSYARNSDKPFTNAKSILGRAASGQALSNTDTYLLHTMLHLNGQAGNAGITFDGTISAEESAAAKVILDGYEAGNDTAANISTADAARAEAARLAAEASRIAELSAAEAAAEAAKLAADAKALEQATLTTKFGLSALGYSSIESFVDANYEPLARDIARAQGKDTFDVDQAAVVAIMKDPTQGPNILRTYMNSGDTRAINVTKLESGDADSIREVQAQLGVDITGDFNTATLAAIQASLTSTNEIGLGADSGQFFRATYNDTFEDYVKSELGATTVSEIGRLVRDPDTQAKFLADNPDEFIHDISRSALREGFENGTIPYIESALPADLQERFAAMQGDEFASDRAMYFARHMANNPADFRAYDAAIKGQDMTVLQARLETLETEEITAKINNAGGVLSGVDTEIAAANLGLDAAPDNAAADGEFSRFGNSEFSLAVLSNNVVEYADTFAMRPGAPRTVDGEVVDSTNISFNQLMTTEFMGTKWYDQVYGSEYTVGDRTMIDAVVNEGIPIADAARRAGITDLDAPLNLEDPAVLAKVTNGVFLATRGQTFSEDVAQPFTDKQLLRAAHTALGEDIPAELKNDTPETEPKGALVSQFDPARNGVTATEPVKVAGGAPAMDSRLAAGPIV